MDFFLPLFFYKNNNLLKFCKKIKFFSNLFKSYTILDD